MLLKTLAVFIALTLTVQASAGSSSSKISEDLNPFQDLNLAIKHQQEAVDDDCNPLHETPAILSLAWDSYSSLSPLAPQSLTHVVELYLGVFLTKIPPEIAALVNLKFLALSVSTWDALPNSLGHMTHLTTLSIAHATTGRVPAFLKNLTCLETLRLQCSIMNFGSRQKAHDFFLAFPHLTSLYLGSPGENCAVIPKSIAHLENLESLKAPRILIAPGFDLERRYTWDEIRNFKALQEFLKTQGASYGVAEWKALKEKWQEIDEYHRKCNQERKPRHLADASNLEKITLDIDSGALPKALYRFPDLAHLDVGLFLTKIPAGISALTNLEELRLSTTDGDLLPSDLGALANLKRLHLTNMISGDYFRHTGLRRLTQLEELNLHYSHTNGDLTPLLAFTQLKELHLGDTGENVPKVIGQLTSLKSLYLYGAKIPGFDISGGSFLYGDELQRALESIRDDAYDPDHDADAADESDEESTPSYKGKGKGKATSSSNKIFLTEEPQEISPRLLVTLEETVKVSDRQNLEAIQYALAALNGMTFNGMTFNAHQTAGIDLEHHLKMCESLVKLAQHFKKES